MRVCVPSWARRGKDRAMPKSKAGKAEKARPEDNVRVGSDNWYFTIVRIDTNQGISGYGEVRDFASKKYALMLKNRLLGENPCNLDKLFRKIKQFGHHARQGGGVCGVEMALMDLAGKAYGVPAYALAGGKFRDAVRMYCDTPNEPTGEAMGRKLKGRQEQGFTMVKMDVGIAPLIDVPGALAFPAGVLPRNDGTLIERML